MPYLVSWYHEGSRGNYGMYEDHYGDEIKFWAECLAGKHYSLDTEVYYSSFGSKLEKKIVFPNLERDCRPKWIEEECELCYNHTLRLLQNRIINAGYYNPFNNILALEGTDTVLLMDDGEAKILNKTKGIVTLPYGSVNFFKFIHENYPEVKVCPLELGIDYTEIDPWVCECFACQEAAQLTVNIFGENS